MHGGQQLRLFNAHYDEYGFQPIVVFDGDGRFVGAVLRPAKRPSGAEIRPHLRRLVQAIRNNWPNTRILIRADSPWRSMRVRAAELGRQLVAGARQSRACQILVSIPGVGAITANSFVTAIEEPDNFKKSRSVGALRHFNGLHFIRQPTMNFPG